MPKHTGLRVNFIFNPGLKFIRSLLPCTRNLVCAMYDVMQTVVLVSSCMMPMLASLAGREAFIYLEYEQTLAWTVSAPLSSAEQLLALECWHATSGSVPTYLGLV